MTNTNTNIIDLYEIAYESVFTFYEAAGFWADVLEKELSSKSKSEIIEMYKNL